jgi:hypothetical protein
MFLVNGMPVCIVEHKNHQDGDAIERAIKQLRRYEIEKPKLIGSASKIESSTITMTFDWRNSPRVSSPLAFAKACCCPQAIKPWQENSTLSRLSSCKNSC